MFTLNGKYTNAVVYTDICEQQAISQIIGLCNHPIFDGAKIRIMPDVHSGVGCTIGTTIKLKQNKLIPNIVGTDIGCGVLTTIFNTANTIDFKKLDDFIQINIPNGHAIQQRKHPNLNKNIEKQIKEIINYLNLKETSYFINSCGSLGGGNHYIEIGQIDVNTYALSIHTGSRNLGKKVAIPLNMKDGVIIGVGKGNDDWNQSAPHGAGRLLSRSDAKVLLSMDEFKDDMDGVNTWSVCNETLDEAPQAYKPADLIIDQIKDTVDILYVAKAVYNFKSRIIRG